MRIKGSGIRYPNTLSHPFLQFKVQLEGFAWIWHELALFYGQARLPSVFEISVAE